MGAAAHEHDFQHLLDRASQCDSRIVAILESRERLLLQEPLMGSHDNRPIEPLLTAEMMADGRNVDARRKTDLSHVRLFESLGGKQPSGRVHQPRLGFQGVAPRRNARPVCRPTYLFRHVHTIHHRAPKIKRAIDFITAACYTRGKVKQLFEMHMTRNRPVQLTLVRLAVLLFMAGCAENRAMQTDRLDARARTPWRTPIDGASDQRADELQWWNRFHDAVLRDLAQRALNANLDLAVARERIVQAQARRGVVNADRLPQLDFDANYQRAGAGNDALGFAAPPPGFETHLFAAGIVAGWEVDLWGRVQRLVDAADADTAVAIEDYRDAAVSLLSELALAYIDTRTLEVRLVLVEKNVALQRRTLELAEARLKAGNGPELDVTQSRRLLRRTLARVPELRRARTVAENRIAILLGERPRDGLIRPGAVPQTPLPIRAGLPADLITRRSDIRRASWAYRASLARTDAADLERLPRLALSGSFRLSSDDIARFADRAFIYSFGPQISFPLLDGHRIDANVRVHESQAEQARLALEQALLRAIEEVENASVGYARKREQIRELELAAVAAERSAALAEELYKSGLRDLTQLLDTQRELVSVQDDLAVTQQDLLAQWIRLYRALGGGWKAIDLDGTVRPASNAPRESPAGISTMPAEEQ